MHNYYFLVCLVFFIQAIQAISMTKDEVLKINLSKYEVDSDKCPDYSLGKQNNLNCSFRFICLDDDCQSIKPGTSYLEFKDKQGVTKKYISEYCYPSQLKLASHQGGCSTEKCTADTDCISNKCVNGTCMVNNNSPFTECTDVTKPSLLNSFRTKMVCGKLEHEECSKDDECAGKCYHEAMYDEEGQKDNTKRCYVHRLKYNFYERISKWVLIGVGIFLIICIGGCCACCCLCCGKGNSSKRNINNSMV